MTDYFCSILIIICYLIGFIPIQANTITKSVNEIIYINPIIIGIILCSFAAMIIFGGIKQISQVSNKIVPIMTLLYLLGACLIVIKNINMMPTILLNIHQKDLDHLIKF